MLPNIDATSHLLAWYFIGYFFITATLLANVVVSSIIDAFQKQRENEEKGIDSDFNSQTVILTKERMRRLRQSKARRMSEIGDSGDDSDDEEWYVNEIQ